MTREVLLHIGLPKTGTTFLQEALWANKTALRDRGVLHRDPLPRALSGLAEIGTPVGAGGRRPA